MKKSKKFLKQILATLIVITMIPNVIVVASTINEKKQNKKTKNEYVVFNDRFLLYKLYSYAGANSAYDNTFSTYSNTLANVSYEW